MKLKDRVKFAWYALSNGDFIQNFLNGDDPVNMPVGAMNTTTAMKYTAVFACLRVLGETTASVPVMLPQKTGR